MDFATLGGGAMGGGSGGGKTATSTSTSSFNANHGADLGALGPWALGGMALLAVAIIAGVWLFTRKH
jgi:hypothetical protein